MHYPTPPDSDCSHSLAADFAHFLAYQNWTKLPPEEIARLRVAYEHGSDRGQAADVETAAEARPA